MRGCLIPLIRNLFFWTGEHEILVRYLGFYKIHVFDEKDHNELFEITPKNVLGK